MPRSPVSIALIALFAISGCSTNEPDPSQAGTTTAPPTTRTTTASDGTTANPTSTHSSSSTPSTSSSASTGDATQTTAATGTTGAATPDWEDGPFRYLPSMEADLVAYVDELAYPNDGAYVVLDEPRRASVDAFWQALAEAAQMPGDSDWCGVLDLAEAAGYELFRFRDTVTQRWLLHARDATADGQAYLFVNPAARRDLVIEAPHHPFDANTAGQGAFLFRSLAARALLLNKAHRCSSQTATACDGTTTACDGFYRASDVAHATDNVFDLAHRWFTDHTTANFAQLHGFGAEAGDMAEIGDGTNNDEDPGSVAVTFAEHLSTHVPEPASVHACPGDAGSPPSALCGTTNVQGRYTNEPRDDACTDAASSHSGRFLHIEQALTLRDDDDDDGWSRHDVEAALAQTWPDCTLSNDPRDCDLGPPQPATPDCTCGQPCEDGPDG